MGIKSLHKWLSWVCSPPESVDWSHFTGTALGVDALGFLYKAKQENKSPLEEIASLILLLKSHQIQPIFVFDGKSPSEKHATCAARRRQRERLSDMARKVCTIQIDERNHVKQLLYASSCLSVNASEEADSVLAFMMRQGWIAGILSMDMDFLPRGCQNLLVPYKSTWQHYRLSSILHESKLAFSQFMDLCLGLGTDYNPHIPTLSYQRLYWSLVHNKLTLDEILKKEGIRDFSLWLRARQKLLGDSDTWSSILSEHQHIKFSSGIPLAEPDFCRSHLKNWSAESIAVLHKYVQNYIPVEDKSAEVMATDFTAEETAEDPRTTTQNVPIVSMNSIRNNMAESNIYGKTR